MVEALKKDNFLSELPKEEIEMSKVDITDNALTRGLCTNCLQIRQQMFSATGFGHLPNLRPSLIYRFNELNKQQRATAIFQFRLSVSALAILQFSSSVHRIQETFHK